MFTLAFLVAAYAIVGVWGVTLKTQDGLTLSLTTVQVARAQSMRTAPGNRIPWRDREWFLAGMNLPWLFFGGDFRTDRWVQGDSQYNLPPSRVWITNAFADMKTYANISIVRQWIFTTYTKGQVIWDASGKAIGLSDGFLDNLEENLNIAQDNGIYLYLVLGSFEFIRDTNHWDLLTDPAVQQSFFDNALTPIFQRVGHHPQIFAWDIMNEPLWGYRRHNNVDIGHVQNFVERVTALIHQYTSQYASIGAAKLSQVSLYKGLGLDFYDFHGYHGTKTGPEESPLQVPYENLGLDAPCIIGEYWADGREAGGTYEYIQGVYNNGYAGVFFWSYKGMDGNTWEEARDGLKKFISEHPASDNVPPMAPEGVHVQSAN